MKTLSITTLKLLLIGFCLLASMLAQAQNTQHQVFMPSAQENQLFTNVTLPLFMGIANGKTFWYVITESSSQSDAKTRGINFAPKLLNVKGTPAVQAGKFQGGILQVSASVDFSPKRVLIPGSSVLPPEEYAAGSVAQAGYSPLVELPNGIVLNASHVTNATGIHDRVLQLDTLKKQVTLSLSQGFHGGKKVFYLSLEASTELPAALEAATFTPKLNGAPGTGFNKANSSRSGIAIFTNGQTGKNNPNRQGLISALFGEGAPNNILESIPDNTNAANLYSPLWDAYMSVWSVKALSGGINTVQRDFDLLPKLASSSLITATDGSQWAATGFVVNCPVISMTR